MKKWMSILRPVLGIIVLILLVQVGLRLLDFRIDLTEEKRFSLHPASVEVLQDLPEPLEVEILLMGDLPGGMRRLQRAIEQTVRTFNAYSNHRISFYYLDPLSLPAEERDDYVVGLAGYGIQPTNLFVNEDGSQRSRLIFPGVVIKDSTFEVGTLLLRGEREMNADQKLNFSIENLEFELINAIRKLVSKQTYSVGMIMGHGELDEDDGFGVVEALVEDYEVFKIPIEQAKQVEDLDPFDVLIISSPRESFQEKELYLIDQYLMRGGNLIVLPNALALDLDQAGGDGTLAMPIEHGLDQLLFRYGVRVNRDFIQDLSFGYHPVMAGNFGDQGQLIPLPWPFYVSAGRMASHPITKGLDQVMFKFTSTLDTVKADGVKKTPLIFGSDFSRKLATPVRVAFQDMENDPVVEDFSLQNLPLLYLLEGRFTSMFKNRFLPDGFDNAKFKEEGTEGRLIVGGTGSLFESSQDPVSGEPLPIGIDPYSESNYANRLLLQNIIRYLTEPNGIIRARTKKFQIRPLNRVKVREEKAFWQAVNVILPVVILWMMAFAWVSIRKTKNRKKIT
ncbi:gliding motility-associated ABC transporter substrate-binding protein GldG [Belliella kenyensis]|uniref:Gliding motility-associated ABC transporter substrate-binding protein GldG n=1 Tax=Belliella kenyensis TaxID=1472724 RepID=A0ABV8EQ82_9BACT|nr:gliding motility-associated ABC transporter substrate-binding protein GldG [Belliella kenyensis]MCH7403775.1 gliding motility-associated ABC transporter substrate-binding protein GldG [Belliella kenyensis]MDN3602441.1 gliding motility-associated ABC transporter substrate-binding protein GldG [Belliella kenyensis]